MDKQLHDALLLMTGHNRGDRKRIEHSLKVHAYARLLGQMEKLSPRQQLILELTAVFHDIGIRVAEEKYGYCDGKKQEAEGPPVARKMMESIGIEKEITDRVCYIIGRHHTFSAIDALDFQLLVEADFLVNSVEESVSPEGVQKFMEQNFRTESGRLLLNRLFDLSIHPRADA